MYSNNLAHRDKSLLIDASSKKSKRLMQQKLWCLCENGSLRFCTLEQTFIKYRLTWIVASEDDFEHSDEDNPLKDPKVGSLKVL